MRYQKPGDYFSAGENGVLYNAPYYYYTSEYICNNIVGSSIDCGQYNLCEISTKNMLPYILFKNCSMLARTSMLERTIFPNDFQIVRGK